MNKVFNNQQLLFEEKDGISSVPKQFPPATLRVSPVEDKPVFVDFEGGALSSDAGTLLLREEENQINIIGAIADVIKDKRDSRYIKHTYQELLMQRVSQIASGNEDANDCDSLRDDPIFKMVANRLPETGNALGSQPTMSRFENTISRPTLYRIAKVFVDNFIESYEKYNRILSCWILMIQKTKYMVINNCHYLISTMMTIVTFPCMSTKD